MHSSCVLQISVAFHLGRVWCDKLFFFEKKKKRKAILKWMFQPGPKVHALVQTIKEENHYVDIFLCNICVQYMPYCMGKKSHVVLSRTKHLRWILPALLDAFSRLHVLLFRLNSLIFPRGKTTKRPVVFNDVRGGEKWGLTHWFKHVTQPWNVSLFFVLFVTIIMVLISVNISIIILLCCLFDTEHT